MKNIIANNKYHTTRYANVLDIRNGEMVMIPTGTICTVKALSPTDKVLIECDKVHGWVLDSLLEPEVWTDKHGHRIYWVSEAEAISIIADAFINDRVRRIYVGSDRAEPAEMDDMEAVEGWSEICRADLPFDNRDSEILLMMGYLGGGYVGTAYCDKDDLDRVWFDMQIKAMLEGVTGNCDRDKYFLQLIEIDYEGDEKEEF